MCGIFGLWPSVFWSQPPASPSAPMLSCLLKEKTQRGEFIQASYRSSAALLGIALTTKYLRGRGPGAADDHRERAPLQCHGCGGALSLTAPDEKGASGQPSDPAGANPGSQSAVAAGNAVSGRNAASRKAELWKRTLKGIVTNPIILGILAGLLWSMLRLPLPPILEKTVTSLGDLAAPLGLMAMGATFRLDKAVGQAKPAHSGFLHQARGLLHPFSPPCRPSGLPGRGAGCHSYHARFRHHRQLLCDGKKHGTRRRPHFQRRHAHHPVLSLHHHGPGSSC